MAERRGRTKVAETVSGELGPLLKEMDKRYGTGVVKKGTDIEQPVRIPTDIFLLDYCLLGGIPVSRGTMLLGHKHSGKTTLACKIGASSQRVFPDHKVAYVDIEGTLDTVWAEKHGVNLDELIVVHPESGEAAADIVDALIRTKEISTVIIDSVAALAPMAEIEGSAEDAHVGLQARLMSGLLRKTTAGMIAERRRGHFVTPVYINQYRSKIGGFQKFGEPLSVPGGKALGFANSVEIDIKNKENSGKDANGIEVMSFNEHAFKIIKNKCNGGSRVGEFRMVRTFDEGTGLDEGAIDDAATMLAFAKKYGAYDGGGSSWSLHFWDEDRKFRGVGDAVATMYQDGTLYQKLRDYLIWENARGLKMPGSFCATFTEPYGIDV